jgi:TrpR-related protein YerC/YecD
MSKPKIEIKEKEYFKEIHFLYEIFNSLKNLSEIKLFLKDILTSSEIRMIKRRWHISSLLLQGLEIRTVAQRANTSTQTVSKIKQIIEEGNGGLRLAIERARKLEKEGKEKFLKDKSKNIGGSTFVKNWFR